MRKGLGSLVCKTLAQQLAQNGQDIVVTVVDHNEASHAFFKSIGFKAIKPKLHYSYTKPMES